MALFLLMIGSEFPGRAPNAGPERVYLGGPWSDRFKTKLDYGISLTKTTASSARESCCRAARPPSVRALRYVLDVDGA